MKKYPYVIVLVNGKHKVWPYPEAQEFTPYKFPKTSVIYLNAYELELIETLIDDLQNK